MRTLLIFFALLFSYCTQAQSWKPENGTKDNRNHYTAFVNASVFIDSSFVEKGVLLIKNDRIVAVGKRVKIPENTHLIDLSGKFIYPSFIECYSHFGIEEYQNNVLAKVQLESNKKGPYYWNEAIKPELRAVDLFHYKENEAEEYRKMGFGTILTHQQDGILRGTSAAVALNDEQEKWLIKSEAASQYSFFKGKSRQAYPSSLMGIMALIRQVHFDAEWYQENQQNTDYNRSLEALNQQEDLPKIIDVGDELSTLRALQIGEDLGLDFIIKSNGKSYENLKVLKEHQPQLIEPINFPKPYDVVGLFDAQQLSLEEMKAWELADQNLFYLHDAGLSYSITSTGIKNEKEFFGNLKRAIDNGLPHNAAILALTKTPAKMLGIDSLLGTLDKGKLASFIITSDTLFKKDVKILYNWVRGKEYVISKEESIDIKGEYSLNVNGLQLELEVLPKGNSFVGKLSEKGETQTTEVKINVQHQRIGLTFQYEKMRFNLSGSISDAQSRIWSGKTLIDGEWRDWGAIRKGKKKEALKNVEVVREKVKSLPRRPNMLYPNMAYGWDSIPTARPTIFRNATVWTNEKEGILKDQDVLIANGKILMLAYQIDVKLHYPELMDSLVEIDARELHLTSGIIDEHSHIAISRGVNEMGKAITSEVNIGDVINPKDINIYRQLSGGVTASQLLHGSANPIGGKSAIIKLRWGKTADEMKIKDAPATIKFALGENVKQSNWGDHQNIRFPQTRMGVEQVFYDAFTRAKEYQAEWRLYEAKSKKQKKNSSSPRKDLELEALVEILDSNRFITCHSYVQSEINMLMHVADSMGFTVNTFTHILEGYKVADKMKKHGSAVATFADWWAYKYEVNDAIPYNAAIMHRQGLLTAINSDDAEMGRRLNQEAAKIIKYGGLSEEEAWKLVTLNPAKMLQLDSRMGSIKEGKDADLVLWTDHPLSIYAKVQQTYVDGIPYYDRTKTKSMTTKMQAERNRIIDLMLEVQRKEGKTQKVKTETEKNYEFNIFEE